MPVDELLIARMTNVFELHQVAFTQKRMFGGSCFMVDDKMCIASINLGILARVGPEKMEEITKHPGASQMIHGGRKMTGFALLEAPAYETDEALEFWILKCLEYNPLAKTSKKKKK